LTRREAAGLAGLDALKLVTRQDLLRIGGRSLEEVYFGFQFGPDGIRPDIASVVSELADQWDHLTIAHWLSCENTTLEGLTPLGWIDGGRDVSHVLAAAATAVGTKVEAPPTRRKGVAAYAASSSLQNDGHLRHLTARRNVDLRGNVTFGRPAAAVAKDSPRSVVSWLLRRARR